jgi:hypothetical protein
MSGLGKSETRGKMYCHVIIVACQVLKDPHIDQKQQHKNTWKDVSAIASSAAAACARIPPWMPSSGRKRRGIYLWAKA